MFISKQSDRTAMARQDPVMQSWPWGLFLLLFGTFLLLRSLVTFPVENVDALIKYDAAARIVRGGDWSILLSNQHTMRWIETCPRFWSPG